METKCIVCKAPAAATYFCCCDLRHAACKESHMVDCAFASSHADYTALASIKAAQLKADMLLFYPHG